MLLISGIRPVVIVHFLDVKANVVGFCFSLNCIHKLLTSFFNFLIFNIGFQASHFHSFLPLSQPFSPCVTQKQTIKTFLWTCHFVLFCLRMPKLTNIQDLTAIFLSCYFLVVLTLLLNAETDTSLLIFAHILRNLFI